MNENYNQYIPELEGLYPEIYHELYPFVLDGANELLRSERMPNLQSFSKTVDDIIKRSGMWDEDDSEFNGSNVQYAMMRPYPPYRRGREFHNRNTLRDLIKILLLKEILGNRR